MDALGVSGAELDIRPAATQMLRDLGHPAAEGEEGAGEGAAEGGQAGAEGAGQPES